MDLRHAIAAFAGAVLFAASPLIAQAQTRDDGRSDRRWELLGEKKVGLTGDRDVVKLDQDEDWYKERRYRRIRLDVEDNDIYLNRVRLIYFNEYDENLRVDRLIPDGEQYTLRLDGDRGYVRSIELLIGAGCVARVEAAAVTLGEYGLAPRFTAAIKAGEIEMWDATCPAIHAGLQAAEKGVPFMPLRGIVGSDLLRVRPDWKVIDNPLAESGTRDPIVILPAIRPDVTLFHALKADTQGNVWIGVQRELMTMAHASKTTLVTVEHIEDGDFLRDPALAAGTIPALYVTAIAEEKNGAWPIGLDDAYRADAKALGAYAAAAATTDGFARWAAEKSRDAVHA